MVYTITEGKKIYIYKCKRNVPNVIEFDRFNVLDQMQITKLKLTINKKKTLKKTYKIKKSKNKFKPTLTKYCTLNLYIYIYNYKASDNIIENVHRN